MSYGRMFSFLSGLMKTRNHTVKKRLKRIYIKKYQNEI